VSTAGTGTPDTAQPRDPDVIEADIAATRERLAATVTELQDRVDPRNVARRGVDDLKARVTTPDGAPRPEVLAAVAVFALGLLLVLVRRARRG
jgi:MYXO-CTERM domain-containing protein